MTIAPHGPAIHRQVDQLAPEQAESRHRFSFIGTMNGEPDLAERSAQMLREELGTPPRDHRG
jgi:hypothetical protein